MPGKKGPWSTCNIKDYNALYNYLVKINAFDDLDDHKFDYPSHYGKKLFDIIKDNNSLSDGAKKNKYYMLINWYNKFDPKNENIELFKTEGQKIRKDIEQEEGKNEMSFKEKSNMQPLSYFQDILKSYDLNKILEDKAQHFKYLLLAFVILQPPIRTSYYATAQIIYKKSHDDKQNNFILIENGQIPKIIVIINHDKVSHLATKEHMLPVTDPELINIILKSTETYKRKYLFESNDVSIGDSSLLRWLRQITKLSGITFNMMRSIYITNVLNKKGTTLNDKKQLATQMRNSVGAQSLHYYKVGTYDNQSRDELIQTIEELAAKIVSLEKLIDERSDKEPTFDDAAFIKKRANILYLLNNKDNYTSKDSTLEKYKIKYTEDTGKWS